MNAKEYQEQAMRTKCLQLPVFNRLSNERNEPCDKKVSLLHSAVGLSGEIGELNAEIQRWLWYGKPLDTQNVIEEFGDMLWYISEGLESLGMTITEVMERNIAKLRKRYPQHWTQELAQEENRDREAERKAMEKPNA